MVDTCIQQLALEMHLDATPLVPTDKWADASGFLLQLPRSFVRKTRKPQDLDD